MKDLIALVVIFGVLQTILLFQLRRKVNRIMITHVEFATQLQDLGTQLDKAKAEIIAEVDRMGQVISESKNVPQPVLDAFTSVKEKVQALDDLNTDVVTNPPETTEE